MYVRQYFKQIESWFFKNKVLILYGARQVGKTTILEMLDDKYEDMLILSAENSNVRTILEGKNIERIKFLFGDSKIIAIDEAQKIEDIGNLLKFLHDQKLGIQLIATGSSSFDLSSKVTEPLTGRNIKFNIYPFSLSELADNNSNLWLVDHLDNLLIYGQYPEIVNADPDDVIDLLSNLSSDYLYQDILQQENIRNSNVLFKLLQALALQVGSEVSYHELANLLGLASQTVERYIDLLEKNFILFSLHSFSRNLRNELKKSKKFYFYDNGIRNAILSNYSPLDLRQDKGALWENFCIAERIKYHSIHRTNANLYFWRTYDQAEVDLVEEVNGKITAFEFKYNAKKKKVKFPASFVNAYDVTDLRVIHTENFERLYLG